MKKSILFALFFCATPLFGSSDFRSGQPTTNAQRSVDFNFGSDDDATFANNLVNKGQADQRTAFAHTALSDDEDDNSYAPQRAATSTSAYQSGILGQAPHNTPLSGEAAHNIRRAFDYNAPSADADDSEYYFQQGHTRGQASQRQRQLVNVDDNDDADEDDSSEEATEQFFSRDNAGFYGDNYSAASLATRGGVYEQTNTQFGARQGAAAGFRRAPKLTKETHRMRNFILVCGAIGLGFLFYKKYVQSSEVEAHTEPAPAA